MTGTTAVAPGADATAAPSAPAVLVRGEFKGRHPQMPVRTVALDRSNKWDHLRQVRLSAAWQTCTVLSARLSIPWVFQLGSRGNLARLSNTAGVAGAQFEHFVCQIQGRHHRDPIQPCDLAAVADLSHALVENLSAVQQVGALIRAAGDDVLF